MKTKLKLNEDVVGELFELQEKGIDINNLISSALENRRAEIAHEKEEIVLEMMEKQQREIIQNKEEALFPINSSGNKKSSRSAKSKKPVKNNVKPSRYISKKVGNILIKEYGIKCSIPGCNKPSKETHHLLGFSLVKNHDPRDMRPLCSEHHKIVHSIDVKFHELRGAART